MAGFCDSSLTFGLDERRRISEGANQQWSFSGKSPFFTMECLFSNIDDSS